MSRTVLVTGGAGFIGSHLAQRCVNEGYEVNVVDDLTTGTTDNLKPIEEQIDFYELDVRSDELDGLMEGTDWVFHQAAIPSVPKSFNIPVQSTEVNISGTVNVFESARQHDVARVVFASSSSIYGDTEELPKAEEMVPDPKSPYAVAKVSKELFAEVFASRMDLDVIGLRYFNVFGPRQDPQSDYAAVIPNFIQALLQGNQPVIYGDGEQSRDFTFVADTVEANLQAARKGNSGEIYNVGYNRQTTVNDLLYELRRITGSQIDPRYESPRPGDVRHSRASTDKLSQDTGFDPDFSVEEGLRRTVEWFKDHTDRWK